MLLQPNCYPSVYRNRSRLWSYYGLECTLLARNRLNSGVSLPPKSQFSGANKKMGNSSMPKHFLDSSVVQPMLLGSSAYRKYFEDQFAGENIYTSDYVQMEIKRSCIVPFINFYFLLALPNIESIGDALSVWSNRFSGREIKAVERLIGVLIDTHQLSDLNPKDKPKALRRIGFLIKRIEGQLRRKFTNIGANTTRCARAKILLVSSQTDQNPVSDQLEQFIQKFNDVDDCRSKCRVDDFFLNRFRTKVVAFFEHAEKLDRPKSRENRGFIDITENLRRIIKTDGDACSCRMCGRIGDAIIALETPENMRLEHTDYSFDNLCDVIDKPHQRHPSEMEMLGSYDASATSSKEN